MPTSEEAVRPRWELARLKRDAYLPDYVQGAATLGYVLVEDGRPREAITPLIRVLQLGEQLPRHAQSIVTTAAQLL